MIPRSGCRFLHLPPELRYEVYRLVLICTEHVCVYSRPGDTFWCGHRAYNASLTSMSRPHTKLLRVCRQIHSEATPVAYRGTSFHILGSQGGKSFAGLIGKSARYLSKIELESQSYSGLSKLFKALQKTTGLRTLILPSDIILRTVQKKAKGSKDLYKWAAIFSRQISTGLLTLQDSYRAEKRTWKVLEVLKFGEAKKWLGGPLTDDQITANQKTLDEFTVAFRYTANAYLQEE